MRIYVVLGIFLVALQRLILADVVITQQNLLNLPQTKQLIDNTLQLNQAVCFDNQTTKQNLINAFAPTDPTFVAKISPLNISSSPNACVIAPPVPATTPPPSMPAPTPFVGTATLPPPPGLPGVAGTQPPPTLPGTSAGGPQAPFAQPGVPGIAGAVTSPAVLPGAPAPQPVVTGAPISPVSGTWGNVPPTPPGPLPLAPGIPGVAATPTPPPPGTFGTLPPPPLLPPQAPIKVVGIQPPLAKNDIDKLAVEDKNKSDALLIQGLRKIANASYVSIEVDNKKFLNAYEAYLYFIKMVLVDEVGNNESFKLRQQLIDLVGQKDLGMGTLQKFAADHLQIKGSEAEFLSQLYKDNESLMGQFLDLFKTCFFYEKTFIDQATLYVNYIFANIVDAQRSAAQANEPEKKSSNDLALNLIREFTKAIQAELDAQKTKAGAKNINQSQTTLSKDYIMWLADRMNRLRVNPGFYRYNNLMALLDSFACAKSCGPIEVKKAKEVQIQSVLEANQLYKSLSEQLFFDPSLLATILPMQNQILDAAIKDHEGRIAKE